MATVSAAATKAMANAIGTRARLQYPAPAGRTVRAVSMGSGGVSSTKEEADSRSFRCSELSNELRQGQPDDSFSAS